MSGDRITWGAQALWQQLTPLLPGVAVEVLARTESTNTALLQRARKSGGRRDDDLQPCLLVAEQQTRGRGRNGKSWQSSPGRSLTFSLALPMQVTDWSGLSLAVGVALAQALDPVVPGAAPRLMLKWPNDLWLRDDAGGPAGAGRKLGGVLIETMAVPGARFVVVGIGLNVLPPLQDGALEGLDTGFACLHELDDTLTAPQALARVALPLVQALQRFEREGFAPCVDAFAQRDLLRGCPVTTTAADVPEGVADGVDTDGALRVTVATRVHRVVAGEVSVRAWVGSQEPA
jgi:BirA family biotin operon repressor/biotin-[acetyl-CoA-carboxylase] ligase